VRHEKTNQTSLRNTQADSEPQFENDNSTLDIILVGEKTESNLGVNMNLYRGGSQRHNVVPIVLAIVALILTSGICNVR
jgi:hypothetical protein